MLIDLFVSGILLAGSAGALLCRRRDRWAAVIGCSCAVAALLLKLLFITVTPFLNACFQLPVIVVGIAAALHSNGYLAGHADKRLSLYWGLFNLMLAAMLAVTMLEPGLPFLAAWEIMGLASFALVAFEWKKSEVRQAAWVYLLSCEAGGLLLVWLLAMWKNGCPGTLPLAVTTTVAVIAFGIKAGFPLLHVWLPEAHPAAPAPVSAIMSGAMIPLGFLGMIIWCPWIAASQAAAWAFFLLGVAGMFTGILFGAAQRDLKRLLAYSSVENIGIITLAFSLGIFGNIANHKTLMVLAWGGALLHLLNHALLKGTLFLGAGSVYKSMHTLNMDEMGGLMKKMPVTGTVFTLSGIGISGIPPFCGFAGELLIYLAAFTGIAYGKGGVFAVSAVSAVMLALTGGTAAAAFAKSIAAVFCGEPRTEKAVNADTEKWSMWVPQLILFALSALMPFLAAVAASGLLSGAGVMYEEQERILFRPLAWNAVFALALLWLIMLLWLFRRSFCRKSSDNGITWDCGYAEPTARMQYTASAFIQPVADMFNVILQQKKSLKRPEGVFPEKSSIEVDVPDGGSRWFWEVIFKNAGAVGDKVRHLQSGLLHVYILMMVLAVLLMLGWCLVSGRSNTADDTVKQQESVQYE